MLVFTDPGTFNLDPDLVEAAIIPRPKATIPMCVLDLPADMDFITAIAAEQDRAMVEGPCQAHGAEYDGERAGSFDSGCISLYPVNPVTTADGRGESRYLGLWPFS